MRQNTRNASITRRYHIFAIATLMVALTSTAFAADAKQPAQKYKDWIVQCMASKACVAHFDRKGVQILVGRAKPTSPLRMTFRLPNALKKGEPVALRLDNGWQAGLKVLACVKDYCEAPVSQESTQLAINALSKNKSGIVAYVVSDRILLVPISLSGFDEALSHVKN